MLSKLILGAIVAFLILSYTSICLGDSIVIIDFKLPYTEKRLFVIDKSTHRTLYRTFVATGIGGFSNKPGSRGTEIGLFKIGEIYSGRHGKAFKIDGLDKYNKNARSRAIEIHGANYVGNGKTGHSWGCFTIPEQDMKALLKIIKPGTLLYVFN